MVRWPNLDPDSQSCQEHCIVCQGTKQQYRGILMFLMYESAHGSDEISYRMLRTTDLQYNFASVRNIAQMQDPRTWF